MKSTDVINPTAIKYPVAVEGDKNTIPLNVTGSQLASIKGGFPLITETPVAEGGKPPVRKDFNGLFYLATDYKAFLQDGGFITFSQTVSDLIGGYPNGAILDYYTSGNNSYTKVVSLIDDNTYNFIDTPSYIDGIKWQYVNFGGANQDLSNLSADGNDFINQSKALTTGNVSSNSAVFADILSRLHSTFDLSKFTVVGTPTITSDGIASGFSNSNYLTANLTFTPTTSLEYLCKFTTGLDITSNQYVFRFYNNLTGNYETNAVGLTDGQLRIKFKDATNHYYTCSTNTTYIVKLVFTSTSSVAYIYGENWNLLDTITYTTAPILMRANNSDIFIGIGSSGASTYLSGGSVDLKYMSVKVDGVEIFSGNETGSDSYTINGSTVTVPYTLTKGGAKIADVSGRTDVTSVYNAFGYAPYYTIDTENKDFTLPMGDLYGQTLFRNHKEEINEYLTLDSANTVNINYNTEYTAPVDGWAYYNTHLQVSANIYNGTSNIQVYGSIDNVDYYGHFLQLTWDGTSNTISSDTMQTAAFFVKKRQKIKIYTDSSYGNYSIISYDCRFVPCLK